jgi:hypothetical protein
MPTKIERREETRYFLSNASRAEIEFDDPDGTRCRYPLMDLSTRGASFSLPLQFDGIEEGAMLPNAVILIDDVEIRGNLTVLHTTARFRGNYSCGVQFFASSDNDQNQLVSFVARLDAGHRATI